MNAKIRTFYFQTLVLSGLLSAASTWSQVVQNPPNVSITYPTNGEIFAAPATFTINVTANSSGATVTNVQFLINGSLTGDSTISPYMASATNLPGGIYTLSAVATDTDGLAATNSIQISVIGAYAAAVLADRPVAYWRLNESGSKASGNIKAADATSRFDGVYGKAVGDSVAGLRPSNGFQGFEPTNYAAQFTNGIANSYVTVPSLNLNTNTVTITAWIYPVSTPASYAGLVYGRHNNDAWGLGFTTLGQLGYTWNQGNPSTWGWASGLVPPLLQWSFVALVISPSNAVVYLCNSFGQYSATNAIPHFNEAFDANTLIGDDSADLGGGERTFGGGMEEVALFNFSLASSQVLSLYSAAGGININNIIHNGSFEEIQIGSPFLTSDPADIPDWTHSGSVGDALLWHVGYNDAGGTATLAGDGNQFVTLGGGIYEPPTDTPS